MLDLIKLVRKFTSTLNAKERMQLLVVIGVFQLWIVSMLWILFGGRS